MWNDIHKRYLDCSHLFQHDRQSFDVAIEMRDTPKLLMGNGSYEHVRTIDSDFRKASYC